MKLDRLNRGEALAMASAVALFVLMFFDWFGYGNGQNGNDLSYFKLFLSDSNAWQAMSVITFVLELTIVVAIGAGLLVLFDSGWRPAIPPSAAVTVLGGLSFLLVLYRIVEPPGQGDISGLPIHAEPMLGIYLGLIAAAGIAAGGYLAMGRRGSSFARTADALATKPKRRSEKRPAPRD